MEPDLPDGMDDEAYDMINAPQFLDFSQIDMDEDDDADRFFDTHREEDDYFVSADNLSPTMHLLGLSNNSEMVETNAASTSNNSNSDLGAKLQDSSLMTYEANAPSTIENNDVPLDVETVDENMDVTGGTLSKAISNLNLMADALEAEVENETNTNHSQDNMAKRVAELAQQMQVEDFITIIKPKKQIPDQLIKAPVVVSLPKKYDFKVTVPQPFKLHQNRPRPVVENLGKPAEYKFKARPAPMKIFEGPTGIKHKNELKVTHPQAPHFASDDRIRERHERMAAVPILPTSPGEHNKQSGPSSTTSSIKPYRPPTPKKCQPPTPTKVQPFSFARRDKEQLRKKELKIQEILEQEVQPYKFHAKPLPSFEPRLPKKILAEATNVEPFKLRVEERGAVYQKAWKSKLDEEERQMKENKVFHAKPPIVIYQKPFEPVLGILPLVEPDDIKLNTDKRAQERVIYEQQMKEKGLEDEVRHQEEEALRMERERQEEILMRKQLVHKPNPLKPLRMFEVSNSDKRLTSPKSPAFAPLPSQRRKIHQSNSELNTAL